MKRKLFLLFILISTFSCKEKNSDKDSFDYGNTFEHKINESNISFLIPKGYSQKTITEYRNLIQELDYSYQIKEYQDYILSNFEKRFPNSDIFVEMKSLQNLIWIFRKGPHVELNQDALKFVAEFYKLNKKDNTLIVHKEEIVSNKLFTTKRYKYIQLKTKQIYIQGERYFSHYIISTKKNSFGISYVNINGSDFQDYVNRIKLLE